jgi:uncharacterized protein with ParB-like and HNH nuclease domain
MPKPTLSPYMWALYQLFEKKIYKVPVYQRPYSWNSDHVDTLLDDIFDAYNSKDSEEGYYTGNLIFHDSNEKANGVAVIYEVIDGQQRITTFALILLAIYSIATKRGASLTDTTYIGLKNSLWKAVTRREPQKEYSVVELNSIEKKCFQDLFDYAFDHPGKIREYAETYDAQTNPERFVMSNFIHIFDVISEQVPGDTADSILDYGQYLLDKILFIAIECTSNVNKVFSMFESINSKGKRLDDIDLIKTYIFSKLNADSYQEYLGKWGELIKKTDDNLYDYLYTYIRAFITFYRQNIKILNFKTMSEYSLKEYFEKDTLGDTYKALIDDMLSKVSYYKMLSSVDQANALIKNKQFKFYFRVFSGSYVHPKPLFMRLLVEFGESKIQKADVVDIVSEVTKYMIIVMNIGNRDSKDVITMFSNIMNDIYANKGIDKARVLSYLANDLISKGFDEKQISIGLSSMDAYENKRTGTALLSIFESIDKSEQHKGKVSYDKAYVLIDKFSEAFSLDHLLVQTPKKDDDAYRYYCKKEGSAETLVLKTGHDFPDNIVDGMPYDIFRKSVLNKIGNLRIYYQDKNSGRQTTAIDLPEYGSFHTYSDIKKREKDIIDYLVKYVLKIPDADLTLVKDTVKSIEGRLPNMEQLIDADEVHIGDQLYITLKPDTSVATLIDSNKVQFNNEVMTLNQWGCKVLGWSAVRIYVYTAIVGETETLQDKREKIVAGLKVKQ